MTRPSETGCINRSNSCTWLVGSRWSGGLLRDVGHNVFGNNTAGGMGPNGTMSFSAISVLHLRRAVLPNRQSEVLPIGVQNFNARCREYPEKT